jgi:hypothetical protein
MLSPSEREEYASGTDLPIPQAKMTSPAVAGQAPIIGREG